MNKKIKYIRVYFDGGYDTYVNNNSISIYVWDDGRLVVDVDGYTVACYAKGYWKNYIVEYEQL